MQTLVGPAADVGGTWRPGQTEKALRIWQEYQREHDVSDLQGRTVAIAPDTGRVWSGADLLDIAAQREAEGSTEPTLALRVGHDHYVRKGQHWRV